MQWADAFRKIGVFANADTPADASKARTNGAEGIGLVRTGEPAALLASALVASALSRCWAQQSPDLHS